MGERFSVEIIEVTPESTKRLVVEVEKGTTIASVLAKNSVREFFANTQPEQITLGCLGQRKSPGDILMPGDRIELLQPLKIEPKEARRLRVLRQRRRAAR